jgi:ABC-type oligopeptide transport system substrate-binding subunit
LNKGEKDMRKIRKILIFMIVVMLVLSFTTTAFAVPGTVKNGSTGNKVLLCQWIIYTDFDSLSETFVDGICGPNTTSKIK